MIVHSSQPKADEPLAQEFVDVETRHVMSLQVYDVTGRLLQETRDNTVGKGLEAGIYFVKVKGHEPVKMVKLR